MGAAFASTTKQKATSSPALSDEQIMQLVFEGTLRGRPENPPIPDSRILEVVGSLVQDQSRRIGVSISMIANHLASFSYYDVHKGVMRLIECKMLKRRATGKPGESAKITLGRKRR